MSDHDRCFYPCTNTIHGGAYPCGTSRADHDKFSYGGMHPFTGPPASEIAALRDGIRTETEVLVMYLLGCDDVNCRKDHEVSHNGVEVRLEAALNAQPAAEGEQA